MTETTEKKKRKFLLPAIIAIVALLIVGFVVSRAGLDKALVKQRRDEVIATWKERARASGSDIEITYKDIEVSGSLIDKKVIVHEPEFRMRPVQQNTTPSSNHMDSIIISSPQMVIIPRSVDLSSATYSFPQPINLAEEKEPEKSLLKVEPSTPLEVTVSESIKNNVTYMSTSHVPPASLKLTYLRVQQAEGVEDQAPTVTPVYQVLTVNIGAGSKAESSFAADDSGLGTADVDYKQITLVPEAQPEGVITVAGINSHWSNTRNEKGFNVINAKSTVGPITADPAILPHAPVAMDVDFSFEGPMSQIPTQEPTGEARDTLIQLKKLEISFKDAGLSASGNFTATPSDILPVGTAALKVTNLPLILDTLRKNQVVTANNETWLLPVIEKITGAPVASLTDVDVPISRERGGAFLVGKSTFEELFALMLKSAMSGSPTPMQIDGQGVTVPDAPVAPATPGAAPQSRNFAPQLPPANKARLAPIEVPDNSVRG